MNTDRPLPSISPARRVNEITEYYFSRRLREVARLNSEGQHIISLGIGGPDRPPHRDVTETLCTEARKPDAHSYQMSTGLPQLRKAFADWYAGTYGVILNPDNEILPLIGSKEGIIHINLTFLNPGDGVLVPDPGYPTYTSAAKIAEAKVLTYDLNEQGDWHPDFEALERMPLENVKLMWVNYPHMPTGAPARMETFERLVEFGKRHGIVIAHDNPYSLILNEDTPLSILQVKGAQDIAIELNSLSKSHNMAGWRVAMLASNPTFTGWVQRIKSNVDSGQFRPVMLAATEALNQGPEWLEWLNDEYRRRRKVAEQIMAALGCKFDPTQTGLFLWGRIPEHEASGEAMADRLLYEAGVFVAPGFIFGRNGDRYIRISLCATLTDLQEALQRVRSYLTTIS